MNSTGQVAAETGLSEKAIRLYAEKGLLTVVRDRNGHRFFDSAQIEKAKRIYLLRSLGFSLIEVNTIFTSKNQAECFSAIWDLRLLGNRQNTETAEYVRGVLSGERNLPESLQMKTRQSPEQLTLALRSEATLSELATAIPAMTECLFSSLTKSGAEIIGAIYLEFLTRASESYPAQLRICAPILAPVAPAEKSEVFLKGRTEELYVELNQEQANRQSLLVAIHDYLSAQAGDNREGANREIYFPEFGTGSTGIVMEVAVPVRLDDKRPAS